MNAAHEPPFARIAAMIGDATPARMLAGLLDGRRTAGEIARSADVAPQTASAHLAKLLDARLVTVRSQGRRRYYKLADGDVAHAIEALAVVGGRSDRADRVWSCESIKPLREARPCYGHLAGRLGVRLHDLLLEREVVTIDDGHHRLAPWGRCRLDDLGFDATSVGRPSNIVHRCVDWSERRDHFVGPLAVALLEHFIEQRWLVRHPSSRALSVGGHAHRGFDQLLAEPVAVHSNQRNIA